MMEIKDFRADLEVKADDDGGAEGIITGMAAVFNNVDFDRDVIEPGAFERTLKAHESAGRKIPILDHHIISQPVGVTTKAVETKKGLSVEGQLVMDVPRARELFALVKAGAVTGMSIGFDVVQHEFDRTENVLHLKELKLREWSLVGFPANDRARITGTKDTEEAYAELIGNKIIIDLGRLDNGATREGALGDTDPPDGDDSATGYSLRLASDIREALKGHGDGRH